MTQAVAPVPTSAPSGPDAPSAKRTRRLLSLGHSYAVGMNRRLVHEMARVGGGSWEVVAAAPKYFHGNDLRPVHLEPAAEEPCRVVALNAYLTRRIHVFVYGRQLRSVLSEGWDVVHCWEEPYIFAGGEVAWWTRPGSGGSVRSGRRRSEESGTAGFPGR